MKHRITMGMLTAMLLATGIAVAAPTQVYSATVSSGTVKARSGFVRSSANGKSAVSFCVSSGDEVAILGEEKGKDGYTWLRVAVGTSTGYIRSDLVSQTGKKINVSDTLAKNTTQTQVQTKEPAQTQTQTQPVNTTQAAASGTAAALTGGTTGVIKGTSVRMRSGASQNSGIVTYLNTGANVNILAEGKGSDGQIWYQVKTQDQTGFIRSDLVNKTGQSLQQPATASAASASTAAVPLPDSPAAAQGAAAVPIKDNVGGSNSTRTIEPGAGTVKGVNVRIRSIAGTNGDIKGTVSNGCELKLLGVEKAGDRDWIKIETTVQGQPVSGYIARDYVTVTKEVKEVVMTTTTQTLVGNDTASTTTQAASDSAGRTVSENTGPESSAASIKGVGVRIREAPVDGNVVCQLSSGHPLTIKKETSGSDDYTWYQVSFSYLGSERTGYVRSDLTARSEKEAEDAPPGDEEFEKSIESLPDGYRNSLRSLHAKHPKWQFETVDTGLEWANALAAESSVGKNLVSKNSIASWKSTAPQAYNQSSNQWYTFDGGSWASASPELIAYYMDPRNFLNESGIYMFEKLDHSESQTSASVAKMLTGTFMSGDVTDSDGNTFNYAEWFSNVGQQTGVSPYLLAGRALQEQGIRGSSQSISGNVPGYEGYFNYFNVGAYAYSGRSATINGLIYAQGTDEDYQRPWNTRARSIYGGAKYLSEKFVSKGQNTLYFQKFNVVNKENTLYSHQYMSNIQAASSESSRLQLAYLGDDEVLCFRIPYYHNMPDSPCVKPTSDSNPNTYLASLSISGAKLDPEFSGVTDNYTVTVDPDQEYVEISATAVCSTSSVGGVGVYPIQPGANKLYVSCKAENGSLKAYTITVNR